MRYETGIPIGRGASAEVFQAWDPVEERTVAIKLFPLDDDGEAAARREREARVQASLDHPSICAIYEIGVTSGGRSFFAMRFVDGEPLDAVCARLPLRQRVELVLQVADAVALAHRAGLVHRDLKPNNVLVEAQDDGTLRAFVLDFGIVHVPEATRLTETGQVLGTPGYLSPEQARGAVEVDARSDVFSLGVILYQVLTGNLPFTASSGVGAILRVLEHDPPMAHQVAEGVPSEWGHIAQKAMEKDPRRRYADAEAMARDLERCLGGNPTSARGVGWVGRWLRRAERHPRLWTTGAVAILVVLASLAWGAWSRVRSEQIARDAEVFSRRATEIVARTRYAELLPRHSIVDERRRLLADIERLEHDVDRAEGRAAAAGRFALGRAELALGRDARALDHLETARSAGFDDPVWILDYSRALLAVTRGRLREVELLPDAEARREFRRLLMRELDARRPEIERARSDLDRGDALMIEALDGFLADRPDDARRAARAARALEPWRVEADLLLADLHRRDASAAFLGEDRGRTRAELDAERAVLVEALARAPSAPALHRRLAENHLTAALAALGAGEPAEAWEASFAEADRAVDGALSVLPGDLAARSLGVEVAWRRTLARLRERGGDGLLEPIREASSEARELADRPGAGATPWRNLGNALYAEAMVLGELGEPRPALFEEAAGALTRALDLAPGVAVGWQSLGIAWTRHGNALEATGGDPRASYRRAVEALERSLGGVRSHESRVQSSVCSTWSDIAYFGMRHRDETPRADIDAALDAAERACDRALELAPDYATAHSNRALLAWTRVEHRLAEDRDPRPEIERGRRAFDALFALDPDHVSGRINFAGFVAAVTRWRLDRPEPVSTTELDACHADVDAARGRLESLDERTVLDAAINLARLDILAAAIRCRRSGPSADAFARARRRLDRLDTTDAWEGLRAELRAELERRRAECRATTGPESGTGAVPDPGQGA